MQQCPMYLTAVPGKPGLSHSRLHRKPACDCTCVTDDDVFEQVPVTLYQLQILLVKEGLQASKA